jgi:hypothetical protein
MLLLDSGSVWSICHCKHYETDHNTQHADGGESDSQEAHGTITTTVAIAGLGGIVVDVPAGALVPHD